MSTCPKELKQAIDTAKTAKTAHAQLTQKWKDSDSELTRAEAALRASVKKHRSALLSTVWSRLWDIDSWSYSESRGRSFYKHEVDDIRLEIEISNFNVHTTINMSYGQGDASIIKLYSSMSQYSANKKGGRSAIPWPAYKTAQLWALKEGVIPYLADDETEVEDLLDKIKVLREHIKQNKKKMKLREVQQYEAEIVRLRERSRAQEGVINALSRQQKMREMQDEIVLAVSEELEVKGFTCARSGQSAAWEHTVYLSGGYQLNVKFNGYSWMHVKCYNSTDKPIIDSGINTANKDVVTSYKELVSKVYKRFGVCV